MGFSLGAEAVWFSQRYSRELSESVWSVGFYEHLLDVLANDTWRDYPTKAYGRPCKFEKLSDFLMHPDGLGWPAVPEVLEMIQIVSRCDPPPAPRQNELPDPPITTWAANALKAIEPYVPIPKSVPGWQRSEAVRCDPHYRKAVTGGGIRGKGGRFQGRGEGGASVQRQRWTTTLRPDALAVLRELAEANGIDRNEVVERLLLAPETLAARPHS